MIVQLKNKAPYILSCALLSSAVLLSTGCSSDDNDTSEQSSSLTEKAGSVVSSAQTAITETAEKTVDVASDATTAVVDTAEKAVDVASDATTAVVDTAEKAIDVASDAKTAVVEKTAHDHDHAATSVDGAKVYASCAGCHGGNAEGGVGPTLNSQTAEAVSDKLNRYKAGEQLGPMTGMMTPIAKGLSDAEIKAVSEYVITLK
ncbi:hypothetical protein MNBD_GAMMA03-1201 [hydrothermal vent metagenome]|uniref:Cytochrome c domain-containing protein n=1 Tax=hydrothermal vent metagenome TaxID=652676 RepID=A0A3B0VVF8_9ZZZZ